MTDKHLTDTRFDSFDLPDTILQGIGEAGFEFCTPIQAETLPIALAGRDVAGQAQTGTGKTAGFTLPMLQRLCARPAGKGRRPIRALVLTPTRELAAQVAD
ncbi:MAG: DEAD/DEAH box helicase, partial [Candidatus Thiodiazotropha sp.]